MWDYHNCLNPNKITIINSRKNKVPLYTTSTNESSIALMVSKSNLPLRNLPYHLVVTRNITLISLGVIIKRTMKKKKSKKILCKKMTRWIRLSGSWCLVTKRVNWIWRSRRTLMVLLSGPRTSQTIYPIHRKPRSSCSSSEQVQSLLDLYIIKLVWYIVFIHLSIKALGFYNSLINCRWLSLSLSCWSSYYDCVFLMYPINPNSMPALIIIVRPIVSVRDLSSSCPCLKCNRKYSDSWYSKSHRIAKKGRDTADKAAR